MQATTQHPIRIRRRNDSAGLGVSERRLRMLVEHGVIHRVVAGSYAWKEDWRKLTPLQRHLARVLEVADRSRAPQVFMGAAAAAIWDMDRIGSWPDRVEVRIARATGGRTSGDVRRRALGFEGVQLVEWRGHLVTSPAQTAIDLAADSGFTAGVVAVDQALWARRRAGALAQVDELWQVFERHSRRGFLKAADALRFGTPSADSVRESEARVLIRALGFPAPELQHPFRLPSGKRVRTDFYFADFDHVGEFDGTGKYFDPEILDGRTPEQALLEEKDREDELRRVVKRVSRWRTDAHKDPAKLYDILTAAGLPSRLPRPRSAMRW
ncbi:hypothetical protein [Microbacterium sp.]|uniref:hypothetical protein n=1 Tax=Microbacterium sp. TaxID=51671 RepID=UPI003A943AFC